MARKKGDFPLNMRRLLFFHHESARDASRVIGIAEQGVSAWLNGRRRPNMDTLLRIAEIYEVDPRFLTGDPLAFAQRLADPERIVRAERNIHRRLVRAVDADIGEHVREHNIEPSEVPGAEPAEAPEAAPERSGSPQGSRV